MQYYFTIMVINLLQFKNAYFKSAVLVFTLHGRNLCLRLNKNVMYNILHNTFILTSNVSSYIYVQTNEQNVYLSFTHT